MSALTSLKRLAVGMREYLKLVFGKSEFKRYNLKHNLVDLLNRKKRDDYYWGFYTDHYVEELKAVSTRHSISLNPGEYSFDGEVLSRRAEVPPLHPNYRIVYETVLQLNPTSILEVGCGRGDHLHNLALLSPAMSAYGIDISRRQIELLGKTYPGLLPRVQVFDMSKDRGLFPFPDVDLAFTQAVLMHVQELERYEKALENLFAVARNHVVLMENWTRHEFLADIHRLYSQGRIRWEAIHPYYRVSPELRRPHLMIVSRQELPYPELLDYSILRARTDTEG